METGKDPAEFPGRKISCGESPSLISFSFSLQSPALDMGHRCRRLFSLSRSIDPLGRYRVMSVDEREKFRRAIQRQTGTYARKILAQMLDLERPPAHTDYSTSDGE